jgi:hypothetical protein
VYYGEKEHKTQKCTKKDIFTKDYLIIKANTKQPKRSFLATRDHPHVYVEKS